MKITPLDIQKKTFRTVWRGLDEADVDSFLETVSQELESLTRENIALKEEVRRQTSRLEEYAEREKVLQQTLVTAQRLTNDLKEQARKDAGALVADAERRAQRLIQEGHQRLMEIIRDINELKRARAQFEAGVRHLVESHVGLLDSLADAASEPNTVAIEDNISYLMPLAVAEGGEGKD